MFFPSLLLGRCFIKTQNIFSCCWFTGAYFSFSAPHPLPLWCTLQLPMTTPPPPPTHPQACQLFSWAANLNFLVQIHFSCLGFLTKHFLSTDLVPCANVSTDQAHNEMFWMKQPHIQTENQTHTRTPTDTHTHTYLCFPAFFYICQLTFMLTFDIFQKAKIIPRVGVGQNGDRSLDRSHKKTRKLETMSNSGHSDSELCAANVAQILIEDKS